MPQTVEGDNRRNTEPYESLPGLARLRLTEEHLRSLRRQGFVCQEDRGRERIYFKLRFRHAGRQVVRYIGKDPALAGQIQAELEELQQVKRLNCKLARLQRRARKTLRDSKARLVPILDGAGFAFHGLAIREQLPHSDISTTSGQEPNQQTSQPNQ